MNKEFKIHDRVKIAQSTDNRLDGQKGKIIGFYGESCIVLFDEAPEGYNPAMVAVKAIVEYENSN